MAEKYTKAIFKKCDQLSQVMESLAHPVRLKVLCQTIEMEKTVSELTKTCGISQSGMSQLLGRMKEAGMLDSRREGQRIFYRVSDQKLVQLLSAVREIYCS